MKSVTHLEKVITSEAPAVTHLEQVITEETAAITYTEKVIAGTAPPITHLQKVIAGEASPVTHLEHVWAGRTPEPTEHEYTGAVPYTFTADGTPLLDWYIKGNTTQSGTPTPDNPIMPQGCGVMTGNLYNWEDGYEPIYPAENTGIITQSTGATYSIIIAVEPSTTYAFSIVKQSGGLRRRVGLCANYPQVGGTCLSVDSTTDDSDTRYGNIFTTTAETRYALIMFYSGSGESAPDRAKTITVREGVSLEYEPYGYKIPISSANTTTPVYLGEVETTRKVYKYTFTGQEEWARPASNIFRIGISGYLRQSDYTPICTHYKGQSAVSATSELGDYSCAFLVSSSGNNYFYICDLNYDAYTDFKSYLATQYAAGTPVTVWYVLAAPETVTINEPLMKIGDYADTLSKEQAGVDIPTNNGSTTVDVNTTVKPSEVYIKYMGS